MKVPAVGKGLLVFDAKLAPRDNGEFEFCYVDGASENVSDCNITFQPYRYGRDVFGLLFLQVLARGGVFRFDVASNTFYCEYITDGMADARTSEPAPVPASGPTQAVVFGTTPALTPGPAGGLVANIDLIPDRGPITQRDSTPEPAPILVPTPILDDADRRCLEDALSSLQSTSNFGVAILANACTRVQSAEQLPADALRLFERLTGPEGDIFRVWQLVLCVFFLY